MPGLKSFVSIANDSSFPLENLPYGVALIEGVPTPCSAVGEFIINLKILESEGYFAEAGLPCPVFQGRDLNPFMALGRPYWRRLRQVLQSLFSDSSKGLRDRTDVQARVLLSMSSAKMSMPFTVSEYTDFYSSRYHAYNVGCLMRGKDNALQPNWVHLPVAYHSRASTVGLSGVPFHRPWGQLKGKNEGDPPRLAPSEAIDFELEMGFVVGVPSSGQAITTSRAIDHIFGMVLLNDWSARDIQAWEYVPLGPFLSKNFFTSISPWIVTMEALEPFRCEGPAQDPLPLNYLKCSEPWAIDINLEVDLLGVEEQAPTKITRSNFRHLYWNICQQLAHHTINGCQVRTGDLMGSGTISGPDEGSLGCLLEITKRGQTPLQLQGGSTRVFLKDHDEVILRAWCEGKGYRIGFGEVANQLIPAVDFSE